ncbi:MAG: electron transfer flavoprotein subunit alpha/FixB family protein [Planctomycetes bacterium]|jgi:electron transfer flavoprotein alpha subunit|nr:electron transfer flavoprotein subunit alpha/FixB family protein [Planctomycetota bacterium]HPY74879.1 electron transfer flavoprotein subunit alpha/FixB family protein [Planctomycetota bacterium]HQB00512.1 electron transfer flavoprotein subunit alpha/FixB family protein [Planctomycetota bacterium]
MPGILIITETKENSLKKVSLEVASEATRLAKTINTNVYAIATQSTYKELGEYGISKAFTIETMPYLQEYTSIIQNVMEKINPSHILFPATIQGKALSSMVAAKYNTQAYTDCIKMEIQDNITTIQRPIYAGNVILTAETTAPKVFASLRPNVFSIKENATEIECEPISLPEIQNKVQVLQFKASESKTIEITEASTIVAAGRGVSQETFPLLEEVAQKLGAAIGVSRPLVDAGQRPHEEQVGQTGKTVSPQLYIACGISGAIQHIAGMRTAKTIVAINRSPQAPIFQIADYGIIGDSQEILTALKENL